MRKSTSVACTLLVLAPLLPGQTSARRPVGPDGSIAVELAPPQLDFGPVRSDAGPAVLVHPVTNTSSVPLELLDARIIGPDASSFRVLGSPAAVLQAGEVFDLSVSFEPAAPGPRFATLLIETSRPLPWARNEVELEGIALGPLGGEVAVNAGGQVFVDGSARVWAADYGFLGGGGVQLAGEVAGTTDDALYRAQRAGPSMRYSFIVPRAGTYEVRLHFAELETSAPGAHVFDVLADGVLALQGVDVAAEAGLGSALEHVFLGRTDDAVLDLDFIATTGRASVAALEVRAVPVLEAFPNDVDFGAVSTGSAAQEIISIENNGVIDLRIDTVGYRFGSSGTSAAFHVDLAGNVYQGAVGDVTYGAAIDVPAGGSLPATITFAPTYEQYDSIVLELGFAGGVLPIDLTGLGGHEGDPYLHVVIDHEPFLVDFDADGTETVRFDGTPSHTHEPGHAIVDYRWSLGGSVIATGNPILDVDLGVGNHTPSLEIVDDNAPPRTLSLTSAVDVFPVDEIPGVLALYYPTTVGGASGLLDSVPGNAEFAQIFGRMKVKGGTTVGNSPYTTNVMVRLVAEVDVPVTVSLDFLATGGVDRRLLVDGTPATGPRVYSPGLHTIEARFAVDDLSDLPLEVRVSIAGGPSRKVPTKFLSHDQAALVPVINVLPDRGTTLGGNEIVIEGLGFFPVDQVTVHWGGQDLTPADLSSVEADEIRFFSPPASAGTISVTVETPNGTSNARPFEYDDSGPVPIAFRNDTTITLPEPTAAAWGPDGKLYVTSLDGRLTAIEFADDWSVLSMTTYPGVSSLTNNDTLGIAFDPYETPGIVRAYVAHGEHFLNGGSSFTGPSPYTGQVTMLTGPDFDVPVPLVTGLPTSNHDHGVNGLVFDNNGDLLIAMGGNTNAGVVHPNAGDLPESPLSGAILLAETTRSDFNGAITYVETSGGLPNADQVYGEVVDVAPGVHVYPYAVGLRNPYGLLLASTGLVYATDNGPNWGFGAASTGPTTEGPEPYDADELLLVEYGNYYGHPNRSRGRYAGRENVYYFSTSGSSIPETFTQTLASLPSSCNGLDEYRADTFAGQMRGDVLVQKWGSYVRRAELTQDKRSVQAVTNIYPWTGGLSLITGPGGALLSLDYSSSRIPILEPNDQAATGLVVYDILPWRAPATGGAEFLIGGVGFGTLGDTTVTIGGTPAPLTSVSATRIRGTIPAKANPTTGLLDVVVTVGTDSDTHSKAFRYLIGPGLEPGRWESLPDLPFALGEVAAGVVDGVLYLVGEGSSATYAYDLVAGQWLPERAPRPYPGHHHAAEVVKGKLYLIGGLGGGSEGKVQIYDPVTDSWSFGADMLWSGGSVCSAAIGGKIYAAGGIVGFTTVSNCAMYDPLLDTWSPRSPMPQGRNHAASTSGGARMFVFGGRTGGNWVDNGFDDLQIYRPALDSWISSSDAGSTLAPLPQARGGTGRAVYYRGEFYVFGGETASGAGAIPGRNVYDRVDVYDAAANTWRTEAAMPEARHGIYPVRFQSHIYIPGGGSSAGFSQSSVFDRFTR